MSRVVLVTGGFDPLHSGHIAYFNEAKKLGDKLVVGINTDSWLTRKKGRPFMPSGDRVTIIQNLEMVDHCVLFDDDDDTAIEAIKNVKFMYPDAHIIFANGGDRTANNIPEMVFSDVQFVFGVGGCKTQSSSELLNQYHITERAWGHFTELFKDSRIKVKELIIEPGKGISYQKHYLRSEIWFVSRGKCTVKHSYGKRTDFRMHNLREDDVFTVRANQWHQIWNNYSKPCHIIEIQYGDETSEEDILRDGE